MKKYLIPLAFCLTIAVNAQKLIHKIPADASVVVTIKGDNVLDLVSLDEFSKSKIGSLLTKELKKETDEKIENLDELGFNFSEDFHYFLKSETGVMTHCFLLPMKHEKGLLNTIPERKKEKIQKKGNISYIVDGSSGPTVMWNNQMLMIYMSTNIALESEYNSVKYDYGYDNYNLEAVEEAVELSYEEQQEKYKREEEEREQKRLEREKKKEEQLAAIEAKKSAFKDEALKNAFSTFSATSVTHRSILKNPNYVKSIGKGKEEVSVWADNFAKLYFDAIGGYLYGMTGGMNPRDIIDVNKLYGEASITAKLDFDEDNATLKTIYTLNDEMADIYRPMYDGKFNKNFFKYINEDKLLGYLSLNMSVEGILNAYPELMDNVFKPNAKESISEAVSLGVDLFTTLIDEKGAAEILRGDMVLLLTDLVQREVTYTDYEYDEEYNYKKIEKTKTETLPDFLFMCTSNKQSIFNKIMNIGVREKALVFQNGIYELIDKPRSTPFSLYIMQKDDIVFIGSSKEQMSAMSNGTYVPKLSGSLKSDIRKNASSAFVNGKKIISQIPAESYPRNLRDKVSFLTNNIGGMTFNSQKMKGNSMKSEIVFDTQGEGHKNSLAYIMNIIDSFMD